MPMPVPVTAILALIFAAALSAGLSALAARSSRRSGMAAPWWGAPAVGLAYALGHAGVATPSIPPADVTDRIPVIAILGVVVAVILAGNRGGGWARMTGYPGLAVLAWIVMLGPVLGAEEIPRETMIWLAGTAIASLLAALNVALLDAPAHRSELWASLTMFALGAGVVLVLANSAILFQLGGVLTLALAASLLGAWGMPIGGGVPVGVVVLTALIVEGFVYAFLPASAALTLAFAPAVLWLTRIGALARLGSKARGSIAVGLILVPVAVAIGLVIASKSSDSYGY
jgi:hypothetical protein